MLDFIGHTPLVRLRHLAPDVPVFAKLEGMNPGGSVKDRAALAMIEAVERTGALPPGAALVEATSGNTGVGLAVVANAKGYRLIITAPEDLSEGHRRLLNWLGVELVTTPAIEGMSGAVFAALQICQQRGAFFVRQFENPANPEAHRQATAREI